MISNTANKSFERMATVSAISRHCLPDQAARPRNGRLEPQTIDSDSLVGTLGMGYGISKGSTVNLTFKSNVSGSNGADLMLNWLHTL